MQCGIPTIAITIHNLADTGDDNLWSIHIRRHSRPISPYSFKY